MLQSFKPLSNICQRFNSIHGYVNDQRRQIIVEHYCSHLTEDVRQCLIYDSADTAQARLIGVEFIISETQFMALPETEKKYWHSHVYEVKSGLLVMPSVPDMVERKEMEKLANTYGKTWHFWQTDRGDSLPLGEPQLMYSPLSDSMVDAALLAERDARLGVHTDKVRKLREYIEAKAPHPLADQFLNKKGHS